MKILHVINDLNSGGAEKLLSEILPLMKIEGHDITIVLMNGKKNAPKFHSVITTFGINIIDFKTSFYNAFIVNKLAKLMIKSRFDIVHAHLFPSQYWLAIASFFAPKKTIFIKTEHSVFNERKKYRILRPIERFIYSRFDKVIAITEKVKENLAQWLGDDRNIVIINNGVNIFAIRKSFSEPRPDFLKTSKFNILMVARFDFFQKDQLTLIKAFSLLEDDNEYHLYFAGDGPNKKNMVQLVNHYNLNKKITFLGVREDIYNLMNKVDLNILSTKHEGLSGVTLEALASGKPFLGSDVVGVNDVVPDHRFLFPEQNPKALAEKILEIKSNKKLTADMVKTAQHHIQKFDISEMSNNYLELYKLTLVDS